MTTTYIHINKIIRLKKEIPRLLVLNVLSNLFLNQLTTNKFF